MRVLAATCALLAICFGSIGSAEAAKKHRRPFCSLRNAKVLKKTRAVRILYVSRPAEEDLYGTPATVYACFPALKRRTKLFEVDSSEVWAPQIMRLNVRFFAFAANTRDVICEKYAQPNCTGAHVASFRVSNGRVRCNTSVPATALALTSNGWIAWLSGEAQPSTLSACDSAGNRTLDQGAIDPPSVRGAGTSVVWTRDGQAQSAELR